MKHCLPRRRFCKLVGLAATTTWWQADLTMAAPLSTVSGTVIGTDGKPVSPDEIRLDVHWNGHECHPTVTNLTSKTIALREVVLFTYRHQLPPDTWVYGEAFQMLTQTVGTLASLHEIGMGEQKHYRIPGPADAAVVTSLLTLSPTGRDHIVLAYTSCNRFIGRFYIRNGEIQAVVDMEGLSLKPGQVLELEGLVNLSGPRRELLLAKLGSVLNKNHPHQIFKPVPTGWCSWYCFGRQVTASNVRANLDVIQRTLPGLKYVQIDDGYQPAMGDWLEPGSSFGGHVRDVLREIKSRGLEPAIWVAPFIAEGKSRVLRDHPEWFVKNAEGKPMPAAEVSFTGWGGGNWYSLDGTHPEVQQHFEDVFRTMREDWGCSYFKLDANFWGAIHGGHFHDPSATRIEAYRRGMEAVRRGAKDAFLLGCNHPVWPSLGLIDGSRSSGDISRKWKSISSCMEEAMQRNWQNGTLWWNDPDAVVLTNRPGPPMQGTLTEEEFRFHATAVYASGGMILSGDDLTKIPEDRLAMFKKLLPPTGVAAVFDNPSSLEIGRIRRGKSLHIAVFNHADVVSTIEVPLAGRVHLSEMWTGQDLGIHTESFLAEIPPHGARLLIAT